jgi:hypothetical protein
LRGPQVPGAPSEKNSSAGRCLCACCMMAAAGMMIGFETEGGSRGGEKQDRGRKSSEQERLLQGLFRALCENLRLFALEAARQLLSHAGLLTCTFFSCCCQPCPVATGWSGSHHPHISLIALNGTGGSYRIQVSGRLWSSM